MAARAMALQGGCAGAWRSLRVIAITQRANVGASMNSPALDFELHGEMSRRTNDRG